ncbi:DNA ligase 1-like isoform X1 [Bolinopsis microptera]|uniref:DNA ligase 1-like isoform X1 n=1 Tax=Bolinopsis microptera TaxID=2820187 RepID=UPI00307A999C
MEDLQISGRSSVSSSRPRPKAKTLGVNFSQRKREKSEPGKNPKKVTISKDSRASTTYLTSPSGAEKRGNPLLCSSDILDRLSRSLPPSQNINYEQDLPVKDSVVMKPNFSARNEGRDQAATKIQRHWRKYQEDRKRKETADENQNIFKMSEELKEMLAQERKKVLADREKESTAKVKSRVDVEKKKREARLKAIEELNKKREEKRKLQQQILQEELQLTTETNKTKRKIVKRAVTPKTGINKNSPPKRKSKT